MHLGEDDSPKTSQHHRIFSIGYYMRCSYDDSLSYNQFRRDKDCVAWFVDELKELAHRVKGILSPMETLSSEQWDIFCNATQCHMCEKRRVGWYTHSRSLSFDRTIMRSRAFKL